MNRQRFVYQVKDWDGLFENNKSRERDKCGFVCVPNKQDGMGLTRLLGQPDGAGMYGVFHLIVGALSRQHRPRAGWLTDDGRRTGRPWTPEDLAFRWRQPLELCSRALQVLASPEIAWMEAFEALDGHSGAPAVPAECPPSAQEEKGREGKRREGKGRTACAEPPAAPAPAAGPAHTIPPELQGLELYGADVKLCFDLPQMLPTWQQAFPGVDLAAEIRKAHAWELSNKTRRKTPKGRLRFLNSWMDRAQNGGFRGTRQGAGADLRGALSRTFERSSEQADKFNGR